MLYSANSGQGFKDGFVVIIEKTIRLIMSSDEYKKYIKWKNRKRISELNEINNEIKKLERSISSVERMRISKMRYLEKRKLNNSTNGLILFAFFGVFSSFCFASGSNKTVDSITFGRDGTVQTTAATGGGGGGYSIQPATVTIQAGQGLTTTTQTISSLSPGVMHILINSSNVVTGLVLSTEIANTAVTPGSYTNTNLTVDAQGRITTAGNGSAGGGGGGSPLEVFSNFDATRSSPTLSISVGDALKLSVSGSTAIITVDFSSVTSQSDLTAYMTQSSSTLNDLKLSSASATYFNKLSPYVSSVNVTSGLTVTGNGTAGSTPQFALNFSSVVSQSDLSAYMTQSSSTLNDLKLSSAAATYLNKNSIYIASQTVSSAFILGGSNNVAAAAPILNINSSSITALGPSIDVSGTEITGVLASANFPSLTGDVTSSGLTVTVIDDSHNHTVATSTFAVTGGTFTVTGGTVSVNGIAYRFPNVRGTASQTLSNAGETSGIQTLSWATGSGVSPGGFNTNIQFSSNSTFGGDNGLQYDRSESSVSIKGALTIGDRSSTLQSTFQFDPLGQRLFLTDESGEGQTNLIFRTTSTVKSQIAGNNTNFFITATTFSALTAAQNTRFIISAVSHNNTILGKTFIQSLAGANIATFDPVLNRSSFTSVIVVDTVTINYLLGIGTSSPSSGLHINGLGGITISSGSLNGIITYSNVNSALSVSTATVINGVLSVVTTSTQASIINNGLIVGGHIEVSSTTPTLSSCGTSPSIVGNDQWGKITVGSVAAASCTMTFAVPWPNAPACTIMSNTAIVSPTGTTTTTAFTFGGTSIVSDIIMYSCGSWR